MYFYLGIAPSVVCAISERGGRRRMRTSGKEQLFRQHYRPLKYVYETELLSVLNKSILIKLTRFPWQKKFEETPQANNVMLLLQA